MTSESQGIAVPTEATVPASRSRTHLGITLLQLTITAAFIRALFFEAPPSFSLGDWAFVLLPPLAFGGAWYLGRRVRAARDTTWRGALSRVGGAVSVCGFVLTALLLPVSLFGSWMDGIG